MNFPQSLPGGLSEEVGRLGVLLLHRFGWSKTPLGCPMVCFFHLRMENAGTVHSQNCLWSWYLDLCQARDHPPPPPTNPARPDQQQLSPLHCPKGILGNHRLNHSSSWVRCSCCFFITDDQLTKEQRVYGATVPSHELTFHQESLVTGSPRTGPGAAL